MPIIKVYSTKNCINCKILKDCLKDNSIDYYEVEMRTPEALTELTMNGIFAMSAPVLQIDKTYVLSNELKNIKDIKSILQLYKITKKGCD